MARKVGEVFVEVSANLSKLRKGMAQAIGIASGGAGAIGKVLSGVFKLITAPLSAAFKIVGMAVKAVTTLVTTLFTTLIKWAKRGLMALTAFIGISVLVGANFGKSMAKVKALTGTTGRAFESLRNEALRLGRATEYSATQAADAMGIFAMAGFKTKDIIKAVSPTMDFAAASGLGLAEAADIAARVMGGMQLKASELRGAMDVMTKAFTSANMDATDVGMAMQFVGAVAKTLGKDLTEVVGAITALAGAGIRGSMAGTGLRKVLMQLANKKVQGQLKAIGVSVTDTSGAMKPIAQIIGDITRATQRMSDMEVADLGLTMFGARGGVAFLALLGQGEAAIQRHTDALNNADGVTKTIAETMRDTLAQAFIKTKSAMEGLMISVSDVFAPGLIESNDSIQTLLMTLDDFVKNTTPRFQEWIGKARQWLKEDLPEYVFFAIGAIANLADNFRDIFARIGEVIAGAGGQLAGFLELDQMQGNIIQKTISAIVVALLKSGQIIARIAQAVGKIVAALGDAMIAIIEWKPWKFGTAVGKLGEAVGSVAGIGGEGDTEAIAAVIAEMNELWAGGQDDAKDRGRDIVKRIGDAIKEAWQEVTPEMKEAREKIAAAMAEWNGIIGDVVETGREATKAEIARIAELSKVVEALKPIASGEKTPKADARAKQAQLWKRMSMGLFVPGSPFSRKEDKPDDQQRVIDPSLLAKISPGPAIAETISTVIGAANVGVKKQIDLLADIASNTEGLNDALADVGT